MGNESFAIKDEFSRDLEAPYENNHIRFVITDTLPWAYDDQAHLETVSSRADYYLQTAESDRFQKLHPGASVSIAFRYRYDPPPYAELALAAISERLASHGIRFFYGKGAEYREQD